MPKLTFRSIMIILVVVVPLIWHFLIDKHVAEYYERKQILSAYKGVIIEKDIWHVDKIRIKTKNDIETILGPSSQLWDISAIGDSLIKIGGEDSVILIQNGVRRKLLYD